MRKRVVIARVRVRLVYNFHTVCNCCSYLIEMDWQMALSMSQLFTT